MLLSDAVSPESPCRYIFRVYLAPVVTYSAYISEGRDYADRFRLSPPIRSLVENPSVKSWRETNVARKKKQEKKKEGRTGKEGKRYRSLSHLLRFPSRCPLSWSFLFLELSSRFVPSDATISCRWHDRTFNFNHRPGNYKSCSRSRTLSIKDFRFSRDDRPGWQEKRVEQNERG